MTFYNFTSTTRGIYTITNLLDGRYYVGSSLTIEKRIKRHKKDLLSNKHHCQPLQRAWNKYGEQNFKFDIVLNLNHCEEQIIRDIEQEILNKEFDKTYNVFKFVGVTNDLFNIGTNRKSGGDIALNKKSNKWRACININDDSIHLGCFDTYEEALDARLKAEKKYWAKDYVHYKRPICIPLGYRKKINIYECTLRHKGKVYNKCFKTEVEAYEYIKNLRIELGITFP